MRDGPTITFINAHLISIFALSAFVFLALCILLASGATAPLRHEAGRVSVWTAQHCLLSSRLWRQPRWLRRRRPLPSVTVASVAVATAPPARARQQPPPRRPLPPPLPSWPPAVGARPSKEAATRRRRRGFTAAAPPPLSPRAATARDGSPPVTPRRGLGLAGGSAAAARRAPLGHRVVGRWRWQTAALLAHPPDHQWDRKKTFKHINTCTPHTATCHSVYYYDHHSRSLAAIMIISALSAPIASATRRP